MCAISGVITAMSAVAGSLMNLASSSAQAEQQRQAQEYQAAAARNNAEVSRINAEYAKQKGEKQLDELEKERSSVLGKIKAIRGASGVTMRGSPTDALVSAQTDYQYRAQSLREDVAREVWNHNVNMNQSLSNVNSIMSQDTSMSYQPVMGVANSIFNAGREIYNAF